MNVWVLGGMALETRVKIGKELPSPSSQYFGAIFDVPGGSGWFLALGASFFRAAHIELVCGFGEDAAAKSLRSTASRCGIQLRPSTLRATPRFVVFDHGNEEHTRYTTVDPDPPTAFAPSADVLLVGYVSGRVLAALTQRCLEHCNTRHTNPFVAYAPSNSIAGHSTKHLKAFLEHVDLLCATRSEMQVLRDKLGDHSLPPRYVIESNGAGTLAFSDNDEGRTFRCAPRKVRSRTADFIGAGDLLCSCVALQLREGVELKRAVGVALSVISNASKAVLPWEKQLRARKVLGQS